MAHSEKPPGRPSAMATVVMPGAVVAPRRPVAPPKPAQPEPVSEGGRRRGDSRQPLDFTRVQQIGRFGLIREVARGGMGQVFLARDTKLGRKVAIKFLLHSDPNFVGRFLVEARATARCTHENIVTIFEVGEHDGLPYMVLEFLEGKTLSQLLENKLSTRAFTELMVPVVRALERAHEHGIVHRDLKPSNIFVTDRGVVKVLDFGVAKCFDAPPESSDFRATAVMPAVSFDESSDQTYVTFSGDGSLVGTIPYMSPEQWGSDVVDHASDLWTIGIMFWRALAGVHPAGTMTPDKLRERLTELRTALPSIATKLPDLAPELVAIVDRCLAKRKADRYQSATELLADLQAYLVPRQARASDMPYRGLAAFGEGDAKYFFGRSAEIRTALGQLEEWPLLAVIGPSGVGKSSFVHAGLVPAVRATGDNWVVRMLRPGRSPIASLANALAGNDPNWITAITSQLRDSPGILGEALRNEAAARRHRVLLVVDQLEELFTLSDDDEARRIFLAALLAVADDPSAPVRVVLSMRADFLDRLAGHKHFLSELSRGLFFLSAPDRDSLRETLVRPAELAGYAFEQDSIVEDMLQTATSRGALALLQFAATRLWDARDRHRRLLTRASYDAMGGIGGAFARHADEVAAALPAHNQSLLRAIMMRLVTPEGTRAVVDHAELATLGDSGEVERILDQLVRARLVLLHTDPNAGVTVEIVHEVLISEWPTLRRWLEDSQALRGFSHELRQAARQWVQRGKPTDLVWRGATAQEAIALASRHVLELAAAEREFLDAIRTQLSRGRRRKMAAIATIFSVLGLVIAGGSIAYVRIASAERIATQKAEESARQLAKIEAEEKRRREAEAKSEQAEKQRSLAEVERSEAEKQRTQAEAAVQLSREELERANHDLKRALEDSQREKLKADKARDAAATAAEIARKATAQAERLLEAEKHQVQQLQKNLKDIADKKLK